MAATFLIFSIFSIAAAGFLLFFPTRVLSATAMFFLILDYIYFFFYSIASDFISIVAFTQLGFDFCFASALGL